MESEQKQTEKIDVTAKADDSAAAFTSDLSDKAIWDGPVLPEGTILSDRYKILSLLGRGGMGCVYKVEHLLMHTVVALKTLQATEVSEVTWRRFQKESQAIGKLNHPNLVRAYDFGLVDEKHPYFVMEYLQGETLAQHLRKGALSVSDAIKIFAPICLALDYAHEHGVIHRDLKPGNIVLAEAENPLAERIPKVVDFGIAKVAGSEQDQGTLTKTGEIFGTPWYMSPEQCKGIGIDHRADIYSLGCVLFESLTGVPPFPSDSAIAVISQHLNEKPPTLREASMGKEFPAALEEIVGRLLKKNPGDRYQRLGQVAHDLKAMELGQPIKAPQAVTKSEDLMPMIKVCALAILIALVFEALLVAFNPLAKTAPAPTSTDTIQAGEPAYASWSYVDNMNDEQYGRWKKIARGAPKPKGKHLCLTVDAEDCGKDPRYLATIDPNDPYKFELKDQALDPNAADLVDDVVAYLHRFRRLHIIDLGHTRVSDRGLLNLNGLPQVVDLDVADTQVTAQALNQLSFLPTLTHLSLFERKSIDSVLESLAEHNKVIGVLSLTGCDIKPESVKSISKLTSLQMLYIDRNPQINDENIQQLATLKKLVQLFIDDSISPAARERLKQKLPGMQINVGHTDGKTSDMRNWIVPGLK